MIIANTISYFYLTLILSLTVRGQFFGPNLATPPDFGDGNEIGSVYNPIEGTPTNFHSSPRVVIPLKPPEEMESVPEDGRFEAFLSFDLEKIHISHHTDLYRGQGDVQLVDKIIARRGSHFDVEIKVTLLSTDGGADEIGPEQVLGLRLVPLNVFTDKKLKDTPHIDIPLEPRTGDVPSAKRKEGIPSQIQVYLPSNSHVGYFGISVVLETANKQVEVTTRERIAVLFNPWNPEDDTFIPGKLSIEEYVNNEEGFAWGGSENYKVLMPWQHDHFSMAVLEVALRFLDYSISFDDRKEASKVARLLSALTNANDENGLVVGKWEQPYWDGRSPESWGGSLPIFTWYRNTISPARYGQCWVFAGVLCTAGRSLGIPSRIITNYNSAHEEGRNGKYLNEIDVFFMPNGIPLQTPSKWVEFHFRRNSTDDTYNGWQVVDGTPQEVSTESGIYQVGPASVETVRQRKATTFDTDFVISEVNSAVNNYYPFQTGGPPHPNRPGFFLMNRMTDTVGKLLVTKAVDSLEYRDVTASYKVIPPDRSSEDATPVFNLEGEKKLNLSVSHANHALIGRDIELSVLVRCDQCNEANSSTFQASVSIRTLSYNARILNPLADWSKRLLQRTRFVHFSWNISCDDYLLHYEPMAVIDYFISIIPITSSLEEDKRPLQASGRIPIVVPPPIISTSNPKSNGFDILVSYKNPLHRQMHNAKVRVFGGVVDPLEHRLGVMGAQEEVRLVLPVQIKKGRQLHNESVAAVKILADEFVTGEVLLRLKKGE